MRIESIQSRCTAQTKMDAGQTRQPKRTQRREEKKDVGKNQKLTKTTFSHRNKSFVTSFARTLFFFQQQRQKQQHRCLFSLFLYTHCSLSRSLYRCMCAASTYTCMRTVCACVLHVSMLVMYVSASDLSISFACKTHL